MARNLGTLTIDLIAKISGFSEGMTKADRIAKDKSASISKSAAIVGAAFATAALAAGAAAIALGKASIDNADALSKMSARTGIAVEDLSKLQYALGLSGSNMETFENANKRLATTMAEAAGGGAKQVELFKRLGISVTDAEGNLRGTDDVMGDLADSFAGMKDGAGKSALAVELLGKSGADLIPLLNGGREGMTALGDEAERLGLVIGTETAKEAELFNDNLDRLSSSSEAAGNTIATAVLPVLNTLIGEFLASESSGEAMDVAMTALKVTLKTIGTVMLIVANQAKNLGVTISGAAAVAKLVAGGEFSEAADKFRQIGVDVADNNYKVAESIKRLWNETKTEVKGAAAAIGNTKVEAPKIGRFVKTPKEKAVKLTDEEKEAEALQKRYEALSATLLEQKVLYGDVTKEASLRYQTEFGDLAKLEPAQKELLLSQAAMLDQLDQQAAAQANATNDSTNLDAIRERYADETSVIESEYKKRQDLLEQYRVTGLILEQEYNELSLENFSETERKRNEIKANAEMTMLSAASDAAGNLVALAAATAGEQSGAYKAAYLAQQALQVALTIGNTQVAAAAALAPPPIGLGPVAGVGLAAMIEASGALSVATILAQTVSSFDGGGYTGYGTRTGGIDGKGGFMAMLHPNESVLDHTRGQGRGGNSVNQTFNIQTQDANSFKASQRQLGRQARRGIGV